MHFNSALHDIRLTCIAKIANACMLYRILNLQFYASLKTHRLHGQPCMYTFRHLWTNIVILINTVTVLCEGLAIMDAVIFSVWRCDAERNERDHLSAAIIDVIETNWILEPYHFTPDHDPTCLQVNIPWCNDGG